MPSLTPPLPAARETNAFRANGPQSDSPGQRPGLMHICDCKALKGRDIPKFNFALSGLNCIYRYLSSGVAPKMNVREAGTLRLRPGWADTTSAGAVRPRNSADDSQRPGGPTHKKGEASQLVSAFQAFDSTQRFFPGPYSPGKGCVGLPGLNRNRTRFDFAVFCLSKRFTALTVGGPHFTRIKSERSQETGFRHSSRLNTQTTLGPAGLDLSAIGQASLRDL